MLILDTLDATGIELPSFWLFKKIFNLNINLFLLIFTHLIKNLKAGIKRDIRGQISHLEYLFVVLHVFRDSRVQLINDVIKDHELIIFFLFIIPGDPLIIGDFVFSKLQKVQFITFKNLFLNHQDVKFLMSEDRFLLLGLPMH